MLNRQYFKDENKKDINGNRPCDGKIASDYPELMAELYYRQLLLSNSFTEWKATDSIRWIEGYANYLNKYTKRKHGLFDYASDFKQWDIVLVDLFGSFKNEMEFDHPALILKILSNGLLLIVPITSKKDTYKEANVTNAPKDLIALPGKVSSLGNLNKNSTLLLNHIKVISKNRVLEREFETINSAGVTEMKKKQITNSATKAVIHKKIAEIYGGSYIHTLRVENNKLNKEINNLHTQLELEKQDHLLLQEQYDKIQTEMNELRASIDQMASDLENK